MSCKFRNQCSIAIVVYNTAANTLSPSPSPSLSLSLPPSLPLSLSLSLSLSLPPSLPLSLPPSLPSSLPLSLQDYVSRARDLVSDGCDYFKIEDYQNTIRCLKEADKIFEAVVETHHYMRLSITDEWKTLYHHLSMTYLECHSHEAAIRIAYSLIELDREYYQVSL